MQDPRRNQGKTGRLIDSFHARADPLTGEGILPLAYRGRFAPTPSGPLHLGSLLTGLTSFLDARATKGRWLLRIDDLDTFRSRPGAVDQILMTLDALGLHWDGPVVYQSQHTQAYQHALESLQEQGLVYACDCTRRETSGSTRHIDGTCPAGCRFSHLRFRPGENCLRIQVPDFPIMFNDLIKGPRKSSLKEACGDFVLFRRDRIHAYHLATVVDDHEAAISHVVRGEDLMESTPLQIFLQQALGLGTPTYAHTPLMINPDGRKLSKSEGAPPVEKQHGGRVMTYLLGHLGLPPPALLANSDPADLLEWAIPLWNLATLRNRPAIVVQENQIPR